MLAVHAAKNGRLLKNQDQGLEIIVTLIGRYGSKDNFVSTGCWILSNVAVEGGVCLCHSMNILLVDCTVDLAPSCEFGKHTSHSL